MMRRILSLVMLVGLVSSQLCDTASAALVAQPEYDEKFYAGNNILFYDPTCESGVSEGYLTLAGKDNLEKTLNFLMRQGLTLAQASGVAGNLMAESGLNPAIIQGGGQADENYLPVNGVGFGIAQWTFTSRQQPLVDLSKEMGLPINDLGLQLNYLWKELSGPYANALASLKATNDPVEAAVVFHYDFEKSADSRDRVVTNRGGNATRVYQTYSDAPALAGDTAVEALNNPGGGSASSLASNVTAPDPEKSISSGNTINGNCSSGAFGGGDLQQTTVAYAWPEYSMRTDKMPAYDEAVNKAKSEGRYIGGYNGVDCGAFVTILVRNSGFDTGYNSDGFGGNTFAQEAWLAKNWEQISSTDGGDRQPGDVAINAQHTYIYVGEIGNFGSKIASSSLGERAPMAGRESPTDPSFRWYRRTSAASDSNKDSANQLQSTAAGITGAR